MLAAGTVLLGWAASSSEVALAGTLQSGAFPSPSSDGPGGAGSTTAPRGLTAKAQEPSAGASEWAPVVAGLQANGQHQLSTDPPTHNCLLAALDPCVP